VIDYNFSSHSWERIVPTSERISLLKSDFFRPSRAFIQTVDFLLMKFLKYNILEDLLTSFLVSISFWISTRFWLTCEYKANRNKQIPFQELLTILGNASVVRKYLSEKNKIAIRDVSDFYQVPYVSYGMQTHSRTQSHRSFRSAWTLAWRSWWLQKTGRSGNEYVIGHHMDAIAT